MTKRGTAWATPSSRSFHCPLVWMEREWLFFSGQQEPRTPRAAVQVSPPAEAAWLPLQGTLQQTHQAITNLRMQRGVLWKTRKIAACLCKASHTVPRGSPKQQVLNASEECIKLYIPTVVMFTHYYKGGNSFLTKDDDTSCFEISEWKWLDNFYALPCNHKQFFNSHKFLQIFNTDEKSWGKL